MNLVRNNIKRDFAQVPNTLINDNSLSDRARFLFCYMAAKPDGWKFYQDKMAKDLKMSLDTLRKYLAELIDSGWVSRTMVRESGKFDSYEYDLNPEPCRKNTDTVKNGLGKIPTRENSVLNNTELEITFTKEKTIKKETIVMTGSACPSQWNAKTTADDKVYIRVRHGHFRLEVNGSTIFEGEPDDIDGVMTTDEMIAYVNNDSKGEVKIL